MAIIQLRHGIQLCTFNMDVMVFDSFSTGPTAAKDATSTFCRINSLLSYSTCSFSLVHIDEMLDIPLKEIHSNR